ncbi:unnamed protein product [Hermetia illucens]|uniref:Glutathione synthetase n=1 Tax=Hermetia illucens TaxID=343691 RepID=A0A7R8V0S0_HERIL|nr:glutathione synthetase-like isoform X2 [Hermetia illucens]CAD7090096.1 unnamed protein product [Hermetia illucens]
MPEHILESCVPLPIPEKELIEVTVKAKDWAIMHGAGMRSKTDYNPDNMFFVPFILTPSSFPRKEFNRAIKLQKILNELMHWVAHDVEFLRTTLAQTIKVDDFTAKLFGLYEAVLEKGVVQDISLGLLRSDYLAHILDDNKIKQVEINTFASSFGGISTYMKAFHRYVLQELDQGSKLKDLPENNALSGICAAMARAWEVASNPAGVILFVIEDVSYNICDQRFHEFEIREKHPHIKVVRKTLTQIFEQGSHGPNKELIVDGNYVNVVYFRAGYEPGHYHSQNEWDARYLIEFSKAIKCPTINYHLAGTKKVQQALAAPGILKRFVNDPEKIQAIREIFTGLYSLDDDEAGNEAYKMALADPERFVLKPQREGGGNNVYGKDIPAVLEAMTPTERSSWILMERIQPPISRGYMVRPGGPMPPTLVDLVSELGIFGAIIGDNTMIIENYQAGHMLRTKLTTANEGGVAAGAGALDSPYLTD